MTVLADILLAPQRRDAFVADAVCLIEDHVRARGGLRGMSLKTALAVIQRNRPDIVPRAVRRLLPEFVQALEALHADFRASDGRDFAAFMQQHTRRANAALLAVADRHAGEASATVRSAYQRMRGIAESELQAVMPALSRLLARHLAEVRNPKVKNAGPARGHGPARE